MIKVKVCGLTDPENILSVAATGADYLGFIFYKGSKRYAINLRPADLQELPSSIIKTGVFVNEEIEMLLETAFRFNLDMIQLHGEEDQDYCSRVRNEGFLVIKVFGIDGSEIPTAVNSFTDVCDFFLFDTKSAERGGTGEKFDWSILDEISIPIPFFLSGGIAPGDAQKILNIKNNNLCGVDINSLFESEPGIKEISKVREFINEIKRQENVRS